MPAIARVLVVGLGRVGELVARLLKSTGFEVVGADVAPRHDLPFAVLSLDVTDDAAIRRALQNCDALLSCLPFRFNRSLVEAAVGVGVHYFDLSEDIGTTARIVELADGADVVLAPQCGLAPGFICTLGASLTRDLDSVRSMELRVGALPRVSTGQLGYACNWSAEGLINEYLNDCEVIRDGRRRLVPPMGEPETVRIDGVKLEACTTSGGLGTMAATYEGRLARLDYKTLRYPGHFQLMRFIFDELRLREERDLVRRILERANPPVDDDVVYVFAAVQGERAGSAVRTQAVRSYRPMSIDGCAWRAISWTTAASACAVVELVATRQLADRGLIRHEHVDLDAFMRTTTGRLFADAVATAGPDVIATTHATPV